MRTHAVAVHRWIRSNYTITVQKALMKCILHDMVCFEIDRSWQVFMHCHCTLFNVNLCLFLCRVFLRNGPRNGCSHVQLMLHTLRLIWMREMCHECPNFLMRFAQTCWLWHSLSKTGWDLCLWRWSCRNMCLQYRWKPWMASCYAKHASVGEWWNVAVLSQLSWTEQIF